MKLLGHLIGQDEVRADPEKSSAIRDQGRIEPPKAARGHATSHSPCIDVALLQMLCCCIACCTVAVLQMLQYSLLQMLHCCRCSSVACYKHPHASGLSIYLAAEKLLTVKFKRPSIQIG